MSFWIKVVRLLARGRYPPSGAACLKLVGIDLRILVRVNHRPIDDRRRWLTFGNSSAVRGYDGPGGFALGVIQRLSLVRT